jgi:GNAT superfamily N-acetyltransferase
MSFSKKFTLTSESGQEVGAVVLRHLWAEVYGVLIKKSDVHVPADRWAKEIGVALCEAELRSARQVMFRLITDIESKELRSLLPSLKFRKKEDRVEYKKAVESLPDDIGTPILWKTAEILNWSTKDVAKILVGIAQGDPGYDPSEDPLQFITDILDDPILTAGLSCIHIGFFRNEVAAMTIVQIDPNSGWSRISYMGVVPKFRGLGLGKWVHRFSFAQMKRKGGKVYQGGTVANNAAMVRLFETHGCELFHQMEEWIYTTRLGHQNAPTN